MASTAALELIVSLNDKASKGLQGIAKSGGFLKDALSFAAGGAILQGIEKIGGGLVGVFTDGMQQSKEWGAGMSQLGAVLKSTGGKAGVTEKQVVDLANSLSAGGGLSQAADDSVLAGENMLLTFTNIGSKVFPQATQTMLDMATAMNNGAAPSAEQLSKQAVMLGKALNDPAKGITALTKVGVTFTAQQKEQIAAMLKVGDVAGAQAVILKELGTEFGGSALASAQTFQGHMATLGASFDNIKQSIADALMPALETLVGWLSSPQVLAGIQSLVDGLINGIGQAFTFISNVGAAVIPILTGVWTAITTLFSSISSGQDVWGAFVTMFQGLGAALEPIGSAILGWIQSVVPQIISAIGTWAVAFVQWVGPLIPQWLAAAGGFIGSVLAWISDQIPTIVSTIIGWGRAFIDWIGPMLPGWLAAAGQFIGGVLAWIVSKVPDIVNTLVQWGAALIGWIVPMIPPLLAEAGKLLLALGGWILNTGLPALVEQLGKWATAFLNWIGPLVAEIPNKLSDLAGAIWNWISQTATDALNKAAEIGGHIIDGIGQGFMAFLKNLTDMASQIWAWVTRTAADAYNKAIEIGTKMVDGIKEGFANAFNASADFFSLFSPSAGLYKQIKEEIDKEKSKKGSDGLFGGVIDAAKNATDAAKQAFSNSGIGDSVSTMGEIAITKLNGVWGIHSPSTVFLAIGMNAMIGLSNGIRAGGAIAQSAALVVASTVRSAATSALAPGNFVAAGMNVGRGLAAGISSSAFMAIAAARATANAVKNTVNATLDIHSPSRVMEAVGANITGGLAKGIKDTQGLVRNAAGQLINDMHNRMIEEAKRGTPLVHAAVKTSVTSIASGTAKDAADAAIKSGKDLLDEMASAVSLLGSLTKFSKPADLAITSFVDSLNFMVSYLRKHIQQFTADQVTIAKSFLDGAGSLLDGASKGIDLLTKLKDFVKPLDGNITAFIDSLMFLVNKLGSRIGKWGGDASVLAGQFGEGAGKLIDGIAKGVDVLASLRDFVKPLDANVTAFIDSLMYMVNKLGDRIGKWKSENLVLAGEFGEGIGKLVSGIGAAIDPLVKLKDYALIGYRAIDDFITDLDEVIQQFKGKVAFWASDMKDTPANLTSAIGTMVSDIGKGIDTLLKLGTYKLTGYRAIDDFISDLDEIIQQFKSKVAFWAADMKDAPPLLSGAIGTMVSEIGKAIDPITKLVNFKAVGYRAIDDFFSSLDEFILQFNLKAKFWAGEATKGAAELAGYVGDIVGSIGKALDPIIKMAGVQAITGGQIEGAMANVWFALDQFNKVMVGGSQGTPFQGDWAKRAVAFAQQIGTIFTELQKALGVITTTGDSSGLGTLLTNLSTMWLTVFGPATQQGTFLYAIFGKPNGLFNWMDTNVPIYMAFSAGVWKTALLALQESIGAQLALMKTAVYNDALEVGRAIAQGIADGTAGVTGGGGSFVPAGTGGGQSYGGGNTINLNVTAPAGSDGRAFGAVIARTLSEEMGLDARVRRRS